MGFFSGLTDAIGSGVKTGSGFLGDVGSGAADLAGSAGQGALSAIQSDEAASITSGLGGFANQFTPTAKCPRWSR